METHSRKWTYKIIAVGAALFTMASHAQEPISGTCNGTDGVTGTVNGMVEAASRVFAVTSPNGDHPFGGGLYISCTSGDTWLKHPSVPHGGLAIATDPSDPDTIYVGIGGGFVYVSRDAGETFVSARPVEFGNIAVSALTALPGGQVFAGMDTGEVLHSVDYGSTWTSLNTSLPFATIHTILVDPVNTSRLLVAVGDDGVYQSLDGGLNFQKSTLAGLIMAPAYWAVRDIAFMVSNTSHVYAGGLSGLWESVDGGQVFSELPGTSDIVDIAFGRRDTATMFLVSEFAGVLRSVDGGQSFTLLAPELPRGTDWFRTVLQLENGRLLVGTAFEGIYVTDDDVTWQSAGGVLPPPPAPVSPPAEVTANLSVRLENLNGPEAIEHGSEARFRVVVRNEGPDLSTDAFVHFIWSRPGTNSAPSWAFSLSSSAGGCAVGPNVDSGCSIGTLGVGASVSIEFSGTTSTDNIGSHSIVVTARNAENAEVTANGTVATKKQIYCLGDCDDSEVGGGGSTDVIFLVILALLALGIRPARYRRFAT